MKFAKIVFVIFLSISVLAMCTLSLSLVCCRARPAGHTTDLNLYPRGMSKLLRRLPAFNGRCELDLDVDIVYAAMTFKGSGRKV